MQASLRGAAAMAVAFLLAACAGGSPTSAPTGAVSVGDPTAPPCFAPPAGTVADVDASVSGNVWSPVAASVGDVITWTNGDAVPHKVGLDDGSCAMSADITADAPQSLILNVAGSYPFHCTIHPSMKGTIVIS